MKKKSFLFKLLAALLCVSSITVQAQEGTVPAFFSKGYALDTWQRVQNYGNMWIDCLFRGGCTIEKRAKVQRDLKRAILALGLIVGTGVLYKKAPGLVKLQARKLGEEAARGALGLPPKSKISAEVIAQNISKISEAAAAGATKGALKEAKAQMKDVKLQIPYVGEVELIVPKKEKQEKEKQEKEGEEQGEAGWGTYFGFGGSKETIEE